MTGMFQRKKQKQDHIVVFSLKLVYRSFLEVFYKRNLDLEKFSTNAVIRAKLRMSQSWCSSTLKDIRNLVKLWCSLLCTKLLRTYNQWLKIVSKLAYNRFGVKRFSQIDCCDWRRLHSHTPSQRRRGRSQRETLWSCDGPAGCIKGSLSDALCPLKSRKRARLCCVEIALQRVSF